MTSGNVSDEPIAYEDDDARERLAGIADLFLVHDRPIETRTDDSRGRAWPTAARWSCAARAATCPASLALPVDCGAPSARLRRRAEEHVRGREGRARVGRPPRRRPEELRDAALLHRRASTTSSGCSRSSPRSWRTTCTRSTCPPSTRRSSRASSCRRAAPPRAPGGVPGRARRDRAGRRRDLRRHRLRRRRHGLGRRAPARRARAASSASGLLFPVRMPGGDAAVRQPWRMACAWLRRRSARQPRCRRPAAAGRRRRPGARSPSWPSGRGLAADHERRPAVRRGGRAVRRARRGELRGSGGHGARGAGRPGRGAAPTRCRSLARAPGRSCSTRARRSARSSSDLERGVPVPADRGAVPQRARRGDGDGVPGGGRARGHRRRSCSRAACSRTACCSSAPRALLEERGPARAHAGAAAAERRRHRVRAAGRGGGPAGGRGGRRCSGLTSGSPGSPRARRRARPARRAAARAAPRVRPRPPGRRVDADRVRPRGRHPARRAARAGMGARPRADARAVRAAGRPAPGVPARSRAARRGGGRGRDDHAPGDPAAAALAARPLPRPRAPARRARAPPPAPAPGRAPTTTRTSRRRGWAARARRPSGSAWSTARAGRRASSVLLVATIPSQAEAIAALMVFAAGTAVSMALLSSASATRSRAARCSGGCWRSRRRWASSRSPSAAGTRSAPWGRSRTCCDGARETRSRHRARRAGVRRRALQAVRRAERGRGALARGGAQGGDRLGPDRQDRRSVAHAWSEFARVMETSGADTVGDLDRELVAEQRGAPLGDPARRQSSVTHQ